MIHIGNERSQKTKCGEPVARRWWVLDHSKEYDTHGPLTVYREIDPRVAATCKACIANYRRKS